MIERSVQPPVVTVVRRGCHEVESGVHHGVGHGVGHVERRIALRADVVAAQVGLLIHVGEVDLCHIGPDRREQRSEVVSTVAGFSRGGIRLLAYGDFGQVVAHGDERHAVGIVFGVGRGGFGFLIGRLSGRRCAGIRHQDYGGRSDEDGDERKPSGTACRRAVL